MEWKKYGMEISLFFLHHHIAEAPTYMHVFLLTLREVMNNFVARGLHFLLAAVRERWAREDDSETKGGMKLDFLYPSRIKWAYIAINGFSSMKESFSPKIWLNGIFSYFITARYRELHRSQHNIQYHHWRKVAKKLLRLWCVNEPFCWAFLKHNYQCFMMNMQKS